MNMQQTTKTCRRILARKKIAGVCVGLAERFDLPVWLTRGLTVLVFLKFPMMTVMAYGLCAVLWPKQ